MPTKEKKQEIINDLKEKFKSSKSVVLVNYRGLDVATMTKIRRRLKDSGSELKIAKNTLALIAAKEAGLEGLEASLEGPTAMAFGMNDVVAPAKIMLEFMREFKQLEIKSGLLEGKFIQDKEVRQLASLPSREVLLSKVMSGMQAPLYGLVNSLQGNLRNFVNVLEAIRKQKEGELTA
jgi:large subunit ribosomal protein L10